MLRLAILFSCGLLWACDAQMERQCTCAQIKPCLSTAETHVMMCADGCQKHVAGMGARYADIRNCITMKQAMINSLASCEQKQLANACTNTAGMVPKRYPETLKLAAFTEINNILRRSGLQAEAASFLAVGKKFAGCMMKCFNKGPGSCFKKQNCGLALPADSAIIQSTKTCAISAGFNTQGVRELCNCIAGVGVK